MRRCRRRCVSASASPTTSCGGRSASKTSTISRKISPRRSRQCRPGPSGPGRSSESMNLIQQFFHTVYNVPQLIAIVGQYGLPLIIFAETGLLVGFFLPGDSLLITAGLFAARGDLNLTLLIVTLIPAAILGNATGYQIGKRTGKALYSRPDSLLFRREHLQMTHDYYERHGGKTIIIAQFAPILRTFAPVVAGVG